MSKLTLRIGTILLSVSTAFGAADQFEQAAENGQEANEALVRCQRYVKAWLGHADPKTGLIPRNLMNNTDIWNPQDCAADNYPFMVLTASIIDRPLFYGRMLDMLRTETKLTCRLDRIPDTYSFSKQTFADDQPNIDRLIFGGSEYVKDGLMPLTEWLGSSPWSERMLGIVDDIWKHAPVETPYGRIPSTNREVNGEMLQSLSRLYWMTGRKEYLDYAVRLADYYFFAHHPTRDEESIRLRDHGCEIISGLSEIYLTTHFARPEKQKAYYEAIHTLYDRILEIGRNEHGLLYNLVNTKTGQSIDSKLSDGWGYVYDGFYTVYLVDKTDTYRQAVRKALSNLNVHYKNYPWGPPGVIADEYADSIEGAINLYNREPIPSVAEWIDRESKTMLGFQRPDGIIEGWHGDGNFARTAIMYALWKTQGTTVRPWRSDVCWGAVQQGNTLFLTIKANNPWKGQLLFDQPRHKTYLKLPVDYPRINQLPEWFTVNADDQYKVNIRDSSKIYTGSQLLQGIPLDLGPETLQRRITIQPVSG